MPSHRTEPDLLKQDIQLLGQMLREVIRRLAGPEACELEESIRREAEQLRAAPSVEGARQLRDRLEDCSLEQLRVLIRAFTVFFDLVNLAEQQARVRTIRQRIREMKDQPIEECPEAALIELKQRGVTAEVLDQHLQRAMICAVFTAHPSEARRRTVLEKLMAIAGHLDRLERENLLSAERDAELRMIAEHVETLWLTDLIRSERPTVLQEVRHGTEVVGTSMLNVIPRVYREFESALRRVYPEYSWSVPAFLRFGSWIGGDRDGNPNVTAAITTQAVKTQQLSLLQHYETMVLAVGRTLSHAAQSTLPSEQFLARLAEEARRFPKVEVSYREPFRDKCRIIAAKLRATRDYIAHRTLRWSEPQLTPSEGIYFRKADLLTELRQLQHELLRSGATIAAHGAIRDLLRLVEVFGLHLMTLDIRQHSLKHSQALDEVFRWAGVTEGYLSLSPEERFALLAAELRQTRPLLPTHLPFSPETVEVIDTFRTVHALLEQQCPEAIDTYIISNTTEPAHLLEVLLLAREARLFRPHEGISRLQIVPLFEALQPLREAVPILQRLFELPIYRTHLRALGDLQEVMIGYSDSNKESGPVMSPWALYQAQCALVELGRSMGVTIQFFHGRGGAVGRGGGPANRAILAQPRGTVNDRLRITEQGEMIADRYGHPAIAERHLGQVVNAVLRANFPDEASPRLPEWESSLDWLAERACQVYREFVYQTPEFLTYFEQATPISEISQLKLGSRPARRSAATRSIEQLRAIPWVFSWMQCRHTLPGWFGLGTALADFQRERDPQLQLLRDMYRHWPFWRSLIDNAQMILSKADMTIARLYADLVEDQALADRIFGRIEREHRQTVELICRFTDQQSLLDRMPVLQHSIRQRNPYVDPLSFIQCVMLKRLRQQEENAASDKLLRGVLESINGIASGLKNTG